MLEDDKATSQNLASKPRSRPEFSERKKERKSIYIVSFILRSLKALRHGSRSFTCKLHHVCISFVSVHQMAPLLYITEVQ